MTHYFSCAKAQRELGYVPRAYAMDEVVAAMRRDGYGYVAPPSTAAHKRLLLPLLLLSCGLVLLLLAGGLGTSRGRGGDR